MVEVQRVRIHQCSSLVDLVTSQDLFDGHLNLLSICSVLYRNHTVAIIANS